MARLLGQRFPFGLLICSLLLQNDRIFSWSGDCPAKEISWAPLKVGVAIDQVLGYGVWKEVFVQLLPLKGNGRLSPLLSCFLLDGVLTWQQAPGLPAWITRWEACIENHRGKWWKDTLPDAQEAIILVLDSLPGLYRWERNKFLSRLDHCLLTNT